MPESTSRRLKSLVTGGSGALGGAIISALLARGDDVVCLDQRPPAPSDAAYIPVDITCAASVDTAMQRAAERLGRVDVLIHAAGIMRTAAFMDLTEDTFQDVLEVNLLGAFRVAQRASALMMAHGGRIVLVTSIHGQVGVEGRGAYAASKGGVASLARVMAAELGQHRIRVNVLAPGAVDGGMLPNPAARQGWVEATPSNRVAYLNEVAGVAALLTSEDASFVNGQVVAVDGGVSTVRQFTG
ncbi:SDR family NAD(P)-dependent oxidoreductase [uncultured Litoreibacter sp.]|uniref:SDR family NAD(P)-dependent oxidoreductase n=1 Tax=uncultured Litoreibacter sp. TaxID=1392394 RepID=UPI0026379BE2|nr:SDR family NAD(P)-dependent oxidoreductase [uncultured Litoreibacter sp.]